MKIRKWQNREAKQSKRKNKMRGGKIDSGVINAQRNRKRIMGYCANCRDIKVFKAGRCKKCGTKLGDN